MLHHIVTMETAGAHGKQPHDHSLPQPVTWQVLIALTQHNIVFEARVMGGARDAIMHGTFPSYLKTFFASYFGEAGYPEWCVNALRSVGVDLLEGRPEQKVILGDGAKWEYSDAA